MVAEIVERRDEVGTPGSTRRNGALPAVIEIDDAIGQRCVCATFRALSPVAAGSCLPLRRHCCWMICGKGGPAEPDCRDGPARHSGLRRRRGARTRAPPRSHATSRARTSVSRNLWCPPGVTTDPSRPSEAHRFTVLGFTPNNAATCPAVSNRSAPSAVIATHTLPGREVPTPQVTPGSSPCQTPGIFTSA